jgi:hypothetical protein
METLDLHRWGILAAALLVAAGAGASEGKKATGGVAEAVHSLLEADEADDEEQLFLQLAARHYAPDPDALRRGLAGLKGDEQDLPAALYVAERAGLRLEDVAALRSRGHAWGEILEKTGIGADPLFAGIDEGSGPAHREAREKARRGGPGRLSDEEILALVAIQVGQRVTGASPEVLWQGRAIEDIFDIVAQERRRGRGEGRGRAEDALDEPRGGPKKGRAERREGGPGAEKITICHVPPGNPDARHTIRIGAPAWEAHRRHGDTHGPCR